MLTSEEIESCIKRLKKEEGETDYCNRLIKRFRSLLTKFNIKISEHKTGDDFDSDTPSDYHDILVCKKGQKNKDFIYTSIFTARPL